MRNVWKEDHFYSLDLTKHINTIKRRWKSRRNC